MGADAEYGVVSQGGSAVQGKPNARAQKGPGGSFQTGTPNIHWHFLWSVLDVDSLETTQFQSFYKKDEAGYRPQPGADPKLSSFYQ
jgi:hypothetical protein